MSFHVDKAISHPCAVQSTFPDGAPCLAKGETSGCRQPFVDVDLVACK